MDDFNDESGGQGDSDKVEITLKGSARAVGNILNGNVLRAIEDKLTAEKELSRADSARGEMQNKLWEAQDAERDAKAREKTALSENDRLSRLVRERNETITGHERTINDLRAKVAELEGKTGAELTEEQHAKLAAEREAVFQSIVARIQFPSLNPPKTFTELFSHFFFPVFQNAAMRREGEWGALTANHKITLIKMVREVTGCGLKEAKDFVEGTARLK